MTMTNIGNWKNYSYNLAKYCQVYMGLISSSDFTSCTVSYSDVVLLETVQLSQTFTQSIDAIDVTSVTLREAILQKIPEFYEIHS